MKDWNFIVIGALASYFKEGLLAAATKGKPILFFVALFPHVFGYELFYPPSICTLCDS